ncbi:MAG: tetratricopeptide repeat protein [Acidobacteria bacterium]|nr:tetratricopeptide repeat protein [Acidobacteriota bacterium]MBV9475676.1 tetratricopeptide repeat protein [Acidobacteriota bacterium]
MAVQRDKVIASAEKLVAKGKIEPAIKEYERLLEDNPNDVNTLNRIGDLWVRINRNDEAVKVFSKIAEHYSKDGFFLKAIAIYKKINKLDPSKLDIYARLADLYAKQGLAMEAKSQYQVLADYYLKHGDPSNALAIYRKISELDPNSINVHVKLADLYSQNNQTAEALKEYDRVGRMLLKRGMLDEAVQVFRKALKIDAKNTDLVDSLVTALLEAKDYDNARQIVEAALEANANHPRLLATLGRIQLGKGDSSAARATLERALSADANDPAVREALGELYLKQNDADRALEMIAPLAEKALARGERGAAIEMLNRILRVDSGNTATLERLVALYVRLNEETNILASMNSLAEAHIARGRYDDASKVLEKLIQREPQNAQHRTKLQFVRSQMGGNETIPRSPRAPEVSLPPMEIDEPAPSFDIAEEVDDSISLDLDASAPLELDLSPELAQVAPPPPPQRLMSAVDLAAADLSDNEDLDFITEHLTEAEVFAKYGLAEKAAEHLRAVLERSPRNMTAHERLFRILLEEGDAEGARTAAQAYVNLLEETNARDTIEAVRNEFLMRGQTFEPRRAAAPAPRTPTMERPLPAAPPAAPAPAPPPAPAPSEFSLDDFAQTNDELTFDLDAPPEIELDLEGPAVADAPTELPDVEETIEFTDAPLSFDAPVDAPADVPADVEFETLLSRPGAEPEPAFEPEPSFEAEPEFAPEPELAPEPIAEPEPEPEPVAMADEPLPGFDEEIPLGEPLTADEPFFGVESLTQDLDQPAIEDIGEIDFYIEQELFDEARRKLETLSAQFPNHPDLESRRARIDSAAAATAVAAPPAPAPESTSRPAALSRDEIESELLSAIPDDEEEDAFTPAAIAEPAPAVAPAPDFSAALVQEENLFADEDNFFDLAAELESELAEDDEQISLSEEEQSLEEIFKEFKKGVEQQLDSEDYDTHYNLGIAYKEMGLIDEAIGEFQLASKDPKRAVECASMLGLCFLEKGMPQLAIKWYRKGLEMAEITEEEHIGLLYDLGAAYQEVGDTDNAQKAFLEVYGMNSNYRDIVSRIKQLEDSRK